jgi:putative ATP-dependent endonuclease of the OLD family
MKLKRLWIQHFKSCKGITIEVGPLHGLVGANSAGKSTILQALDLLFNGSISKLDEESFWHKDTTKPIRIEGLFADLTASEKEAMGPYLRPDDTFHFARKVAYRANGDAESDEKKLEIVPEYNKPQPKMEWLVTDQITLLKLKEWTKVLETLSVRGKAFGGFLGEAKPTVDLWKKKAAEFVAQILKPEDLEDKWTENPKGFPNVLKANLPHFELIPAVRDVVEESKVLKTNPFGRLVKRILEGLDATLRGEMEALLGGTTKKLNRSGAAERASSVVSAENDMKAFLSEMMSADLELEFQPPSVEDLLATPRLIIDDGFKGAIQGKGHGLQRAVIFSILRSYAALATKRQDGAKRTLILAVEEPELYMHPTALRTVRTLLKKISDSGDQVIFSTHSPLMVDVTFFDEIVRVECEDRKEVGTKVWQLSMGAMIADLEARYPALKGKISPESMRERYGHAYTATRNEGFFARRVLLVEGPTEAYCMPIYARAIGKDLDTLGVVVVECGGKDQIDRLYRVFNELGIPCFILFDYDRAKPEAVKSSKELLTFLSEPTEAPEKPLVKDRFACFPSTWETDLPAELADYKKLEAEAGTQLGSCGKPLKARYVATKWCGSGGAVPGTLKAIIENVLKLPLKGSCLKNT